MVCDIMFVYELNMEISSDKSRWQSKMDKLFYGYSLVEVSFIITICLSYSDSSRFYHALCSVGWATIIVLWLDKCYSAIRPKWIATKIMAQLWHMYYVNIDISLVITLHGWYEVNPYKCGVWGDFTNYCNTFPGLLIMCCLKFYFQMRPYTSAR